MNERICLYVKLFLLIFFPGTVRGGSKREAGLLHPQQHYRKHLYPFWGLITFRFFNWEGLDLVDIFKGVMKDWDLRRQDFKLCPLVTLILWGNFTYWDKGKIFMQWKVSLVKSQIPRYSFHRKILLSWWKVKCFEHV